jgi:2'-5' RNA ligase
MTAVPGGAKPIVSPDAVRAFVSLALPPSAVAAVQIAQTSLRETLADAARGLRWSDASNSHLTLAFLGDVPLARVPAIVAALDSIGSTTRPIGLASGSFGCFPTPNDPRVLWLGVEADIAALAALRDRVHQALKRLGCPLERREFSPHLTLARTRGDMSAADREIIVAGIAEASAPPRTDWTSTEIDLMKSDLRPTGAVHSRLNASKLSGQ